MFLIFAILWFIFGMWLESGSHLNCWYHASRVRMCWNWDDLAMLNGAIINFLYRIWIICLDLPRWLGLLEVGGWSLVLGSLAELFWLFSSSVLEVYLFSTWCIPPLVNTISHWFQTPGGSHQPEWKMKWFTISGFVGCIAVACGNMAILLLFYKIYLCDILFTWYKAIILEAPPV